MWRAEQEKEHHFLYIYKQKFMLSLYTSLILLSENR